MLASARGDVKEKYRILPSLTLGVRRQLRLQISSRLTQRSDHTRLGVHRPDEMNFSSIGRTIGYDIDPELRWIAADRLPCLVAEIRDRPTFDQLAGDFRSTLEDLKSLSGTLILLDFLAGGLFRFLDRVNRLPLKNGIGFQLEAGRRPEEAPED